MSAFEIPYARVLAAKEAALELISRSMKNYIRYCQSTMHYCLSTLVDLLRDLKTDVFVTV